VAIGEGSGGEGSPIRAILVPILSQTGYGGGTEGRSVDIRQSFFGAGKAVNRGVSLKDIELNYMNLWYGFTICQLV